MTERMPRQRRRPVPLRLLGRESEMVQLNTLVQRSRAGQSGALILTGPAGVGKTALLDAITAQVTPDVRVQRMVASQSEIELTYAGLQLMCGDLLTPASDLPEPQRQALESAFGLREAADLNPLVLGLAVRSLLNDASGNGTLLCVVDDAQWLDEMSARALSSLARRLGSARVALIIAMRQPDDRFSDLPQLALEGLDTDTARQLLDQSLPPGIDQRVYDQLLTESRGNPLALQELPRSLSPADLAGGFALATSMPLELRIEQSVLAQLESLPASTRTLLLLAAADPTGAVDVLWRASGALQLTAKDFNLAQQADALVVAERVSFRHPLIRSAVYRVAAPHERQAVHAALAEATDPDRDPDRRAWHRATATTRPDEEIASELELSAERARKRGGAAAAAAFLDRAAELTPDSATRTVRLLAAADAMQDAGAPEAAIRLLDSTQDHATSPKQDALIARMRARAAYSMRRDRTAPLALLGAAQALKPYDVELAHDTFMLALSAALYAGRLGEPGAVEQIASAILAATDPESQRAQDLMLRGQGLLFSKGVAAAVPTLRRAIATYLDQPVGARDLQWLWIGARAAQDIWDAEGLRTLAIRQVELARKAGVLAVLPMALNLLMVVRTFDGDLDAAEALCDDIDTMLSVTGHPLPLYGRIFVAAYRGHVEEVERRAAQLRDDAHRRGEGYALTVANMAEALVYNGAGRYEDALSSGRGEMPYTHELSHAMRSLVEVVEAACRCGETQLAQTAVAQLAEVTDPVSDSPWATAMMSLVRAQVSQGVEAEQHFQRAIDGFDRIRVPMLKGRAHLLYGEMLRRDNRRVDARKELRAAHELLTRTGMAGFAERAHRELIATGEKLRTADLPTSDPLTEQERAVALLARDGLTNREIGERLFLSAHTVEWHLRKVFRKLSVKSRTELRRAFPAEQSDPRPG